MDTPGQTCCVACGCERQKDTGRLRPPARAGLSIERFADRRVVSCRRCGLLSVRPPLALTAEDCRQMYDGGYFVWGGPLWARCEAREIRQRLARLLALRPGARTFLDVGCGRGAAMREAGRLGLRAVGQEVSDNRAADARGCGFFLGELAEMAGQERHRGAFDLVYMNSILEHVPDPAGLLASARRLIRPGGALYVGVPNEASLRKRAQGLLRKALSGPGVAARIAPLRPPYHLWGFSPRALDALLRRAGFRPRAALTRSGLMDFARNRPASRGFVLELLGAVPALADAACGSGYYLEVFCEAPPPAARR